MNLKHRQLDPNVNRSRIIPGSAATVDRVPHQLVQPKADPENPYINTHLGLFMDVVQDENNAERPYAFYIPTTMKTSGSMVNGMLSPATLSARRRAGIWKTPAWRSTWL